MREYLLKHKAELEDYEFNIQDARNISEAGRRADGDRETKLLEYIEEILA
ncbi:hypothetical protein KEJ51_04650 [Candidatus Bathyarchaeota archaeon]|nr:hypothetical protein [Candidatus Bathyarchaeota archaeon]MBS7628695.1 hypothetical protein [Candidatus Bathyarchaeota archaeon]